MEHSSAMLISCNLDKVRELPAPGCEWRFSRVEEDVSRSVLYRLREGGLIERKESGLYVTTELLTRYVEGKHGVTLGFSGQTSLDAFSRVSSEASAGGSVSG